MALASPTVAEIMTTEPVAISAGAPVARALAAMRTRHIHELPVVDDGRLRGVVTLEEIARHVHLPLDAKVRHLLVLPPTVRPTSRWDEAAELMLASGLRELPVIDRQRRLVGVISRTDLVRFLPRITRFMDARPEEVASPLSGTAQEDAPIGPVVPSLRESPPLAVVDRRGRLVGSLGTSDLAEAYWRPKQGGKSDRPREVEGRGRVDRVEVRSFMNAPAVSCAPNQPIVEAAEQMARASVSSVFVVDDGVPVAVLTQEDLLESAVGGRGGASGTGEVFVSIHGGSVQHLPGLMADLDLIASKGLTRIRRRLGPILLDLQLAPVGVHRSGEVRVLGRLHTDRGIFRASHTGWDPRVTTTRVLLQLERRVRRKTIGGQRPHRIGSRRVVRVRGSRQ